MDDGIYTVEITLSGGTGKASVASPVKIAVNGGEMTARVEWSSSNYDLMIVDGKEFLPVNSTGNSVFEIPVYSLDEPLSVRAETIAMSEPHMIDYIITFEPATVHTSGTTDTGNVPSIPLIAAVCAAAVISAAAAAITIIRKRKSCK